MKLRAWVPFFTIGWGVGVAEGVQFRNQIPLEQCISYLQEHIPIGYYGGVTEEGTSCGLKVEHASESRDPRIVIHVRHYLGRQDFGNISLSVWDHTRSTTGAYHLSEECQKFSGGLNVYSDLVRESWLTSIEAQRTRLMFDRSQRWIGIVFQLRNAKEQYASESISEYGQSGAKKVLSCYILGPDASEASRWPASLKEKKKGSKPAASSR